MPLTSNQSPFAYLPTRLPLSAMVVLCSQGSLSLQSSIRYGQVTGARFSL